MFKVVTDARITNRRSGYRKVFLLRVADSVFFQKKKSLLRSCFTAIMRALFRSRQNRRDISCALWSTSSTKETVVQR